MVVGNREFRIDDPTRPELSQARRLRDNNVLINGAVREGKLRVEAANYSLDDGMVTILPA